MGGELDRHGHTSQGRTPLASSDFFDFELPGEMAFRGGRTYHIVTDAEERVQLISVTSAHETWPELTAALMASVKDQERRGWKPTFVPRELEELLARRARSVGTSDSGTVAVFAWTKGDVSLQLSIASLWDPIPWYRRADHAPYFWRTLDVSRVYVPTEPVRTDFPSPSP